jgi:hypothetical protein
MTTRIHVVQHDDFDDTPNAEAVVFSVNGDSYEVHLSKKNRAEFLRTLAPYIKVSHKPKAVDGTDAGTSTPVPRQRKAAAKPKVSNDEVRTWAAEHWGGKPVAERGRIAQDVVNAYLKSKRPARRTRRTRRTSVVN